MIKVFDRVTESYFEHLLLVLKAISKDKSSLTKWIVDEMSGESELDLSISAKFDLTRNQMMQLFDAAKFTAVETNCNQKQLQQLSTKLAKRKEFRSLLRKANKARFTEFFQKLSPGLSAYREMRIEKVAIQKSVAFLKIFGISPVLKFMRGDEIGVDEIRIASYKPKPRYVTAFLIEVAIKTTLGEEYIAFQATPDDLSAMRKAIDVAEIEMNTLEFGYKKRKV